jgi:hypothetical protein
LIAILASESQRNYRTILWVAPLWRAHTKIPERLPLPFPSLIDNCLDHPYANYPISLIQLDLHTSLYVFLIVIPKKQLQGNVVFDSELEYLVSRISMNNA